MGPQIDVMNQAYAPSGFKFNLLDTDFSANDDWAVATQASPAELEMKKALHRGSYSNLNLYFLSDLGDDLLGFCYFPEAKPSEEELVLDGCVNLAGTLSGANVSQIHLLYRISYQTISSRTAVN